MKEVKTLNDLKERLNLSDAEVGDAVHWVKLIEYHFFNVDHTANYRNQAIDFCIENKIDFVVTQNNPYEMVTRFIGMKCPKCSSEMKLKSSGGDTHTHHIVCRCAKCGIEGSLRIDVPDGMSFHFRR